MAYLRPLEKHLVGVMKLLRQTEDTRRALMQALESIPVSPDPATPVRAAVAGIDGLSKEDAGQIGEALLSLYSGRAARSEDSTTTFIDDVIQTVEESSGEPFEEELREIMRQQLTHILGVESLSVSAKVTSIMFEHDRLFAHANVFSDLRPVFGADPNDAPKAAIIVHNLSIHYYQDNEHKEFFAALDTADIQSLIKTLERAKAKADTLKATLAAANIPYIEAQ